MADLKIAKARLRLKTIANGVSATGVLAGDAIALATARIFLGPSLFNVDARRQTRPLAEPDLYIAGSELSTNGITNPLTIPWRMEVSLDGNLAQVLTNIDNLLVALAQAWKTAGSYPGGEIVCGDVQWQDYEIDDQVSRINVLVNGYALFPTPL